MKKCYKCQEVKAYSEFNKSKAKRDGYQDICRLCQAGENRKRYGKPNATRDAIIQARQDRVKAVLLAVKEGYNTVDKVKDHLNIKYHVARGALDSLVADGEIIASIEYGYIALQVDKLPIKNDPLFTELLEYAPEVHHLYLGGVIGRISTKYGAIDDRFQDLRFTRLVVNALYTKRYREIYGRYPLAHISNQKDAK